MDKGGDSLMTYLEGIIGKTLCLLHEKAEGERGDEDFKTLDLEAGKTVVVSFGQGTQKY